MPDSEQKRLTFPVNDTNIPVDYQMPSNNQNRSKWKSYNKEE